MYNAAMLEIRPDLREAYNSLCYQGEQFVDPHEIIQLEGLTFAHPKKGDVPIKIDTEILAAQGTLYVGDPALRYTLQGYGIETDGHENAMYFLASHLDTKAEKLVWGFSGYATGGLDPETDRPYGYAEEAQSLLTLYNYLDEEGKAPSLAVDGGVSEGFLALNSVVAASANVPTLGFIPKQGLKSVGIRDHMVVAGETYQDREALVATADVLAFAGGAAGTTRECIGAVRNGAAALVLWHEKYRDDALPNAFLKHKDLREAFGDGRLAVCKSLEEIPEKVDQVLQVDVKASRARRVKGIAGFLFGTGS
jgi:hypothetical protein